MTTIAQRMKEALDIRNMKQTELVDKTGINKSSISTYLSGEYKPKQKNLYKIAKALDVNESWLMGLDVPMERENPIMHQVNSEMIFESHLRLIGWTFEHITFNDGLNCSECMDRQAVKLGLVPESKYPDGNFEPFCDHCNMHDDYYTFTNGKISFNVTPDDFKLFMDDSDEFYKARIQSLLNKYTRNLFNKPSNKQIELVAAHKRTDVEYSAEEEQADYDMMSDENF